MEDKLFNNLIKIQFCNGIKNSFSIKFAIYVICILNIISVRNVPSVFLILFPVNNRPYNIKLTEYSMVY